MSLKPTFTKLLSPLLRESTKSFLIQQHLVNHALDTNIINNAVDKGITDEY